MPELRDHMTIFSLSEVARSIQKTLSDRYKQAYWIKAEMNKLNLYKHSGHCYPELVEKAGGKVVAEMRAILWKSDYERIQLKFQQVLGEGLQQGITILFLANIQYDPTYGLSLRILDIDPSYSLGVLEKEKLESIQKLKSLGLFNANKQLPFPLLPKRLAVISVESSKGYADFLKIIQNNPRGYRLEHTLFPALLQGHRAVASIKSQLQHIRQQRHLYDVVLIIRGGGGEVGLTSYNHYDLAATVAGFPLPVMTGIGHATNETVTEMVAYKQAVTPSELAEFLLQKFKAIDEQLLLNQRTLNQILPQILQDHHTTLSKYGDRLITQAQQMLISQSHQLERIQWNFQQQISRQVDAAHFQLLQMRQELEKAAMQRILLDNQTLAHQSKMVSLMDPAHLMKRGFSMTFANGKLLTHPQSLSPGDRIETHLYEGKITSTVETLSMTSHENS